MSRYVLIRNYVDGEVYSRAEFQLGLRSKITIGRSHTCDFMVSAWGELGRGVSRVHCTISLDDGDVVTIQDGDGLNNSRWGTYWGRKRLDKGEELELPEDEEAVIIAIAPHQITAQVSRYRLIEDSAVQDETVRTNLYTHQLEMRVAELEQTVERLQSQINELRGA